MAERPTREEPTTNPLSDLSDEDLDVALSGELGGAPAAGVPAPQARPAAPGAAAKPAPAPVPPVPTVPAAPPPEKPTDRVRVTIAPGAAGAERRRVARYWTEKKEPAAPPEESGPGAEVFAPKETAAPEPPPPKPREDDAWAPEVLLARLEGNLLRYAGYLDQTPYTEVYGRILATRETGVLVVRRGEATKSVWFVKGDPVFATSNVEADRAGASRVRAGKVSAERLAAAREAAGDDRIALLAELGVEGDEALRAAVLEQVMGVLESLFELRSGDFSFLLLDPPMGARVKIPVPAPAILMEGIRRHYGRPEIARRLRDDGRVPDPILKPDPSRLGLTPPEAALLAQIDGVKSVAKLLEMAVKPDEAARVLYALVCMGSVKLKIIV